MKKNEQKPPRTLSELADDVEAKSFELRRKLAKRMILGQKNLSSDNWYMFCLYYLEATKKLINELPETKHDKDEIDMDRAQVVPAVFLFKHTLELIVKFIVVTVTNENQKKHNVDEVLTKLDIKKFQEKIDWKEVAPLLGLTQSSSKKTVERMVLSLKDLAERYVFNIGFSDANYVVIDNSNELYKYPTTNQVQFIVDPLSLYDASPADIKRIKKDLKSLESIFQLSVILFTSSKLFGSYN